MRKVYVYVKFSVFSPVLISCRVVSCSPLSGRKLWLMQPLWGQSHHVLLSESLPPIPCGCREFFIQVYSPFVSKLSLFLGSSSIVQFLNFQKRGKHTPVMVLTCGSSGHFFRASHHSLWGLFHTVCSLLGYFPRINFHLVDFLRKLP